KHGDGACDLVPLYGLTKRRIRAVARALGVPKRIVDKTPTADLDSDRPGLADEEALDLTYREIDAFLEGEPVSAETVERLLSRLGLQNEFDSTGGDPPEAIAYLRRVGATSGDIEDAALLRSDAIVHVAAPTPEPVAEFCAELSRLLPSAVKPYVLAGVVRPMN